MASSGVDPARPGCSNPRRDGRLGQPRGVPQAEGSLMAQARTPTLCSVTTIVASAQASPIKAHATASRAAQPVESRVCPAWRLTSMRPTTASSEPAHTRRRSPASAPADDLPHQAPQAGITGAAPSGKGRRRVSSGRNPMPPPNWQRPAAPTAIQAPNDPPAKESSGQRPSPPRRHCPQ
jgi:hypothetical protein